MELADSLKTHFRLQKPQEQALKKLGIHTVRDLLFHFPARYENVRDIKTAHQVAKGEHAILYGTVSGLKTRKAYKSKRPIAEGTFADQSGTLKIIWFNQPYIAKMLRDGGAVKLTGRIEGDKNRLYIANPEVEQLAGVPANIHESLFGDGSSEEAFFPIYPESRGISSRWMYHALQRVFKSGILDRVTDPIPRDILKRYNLPPLSSALIYIHTPRSEKDSEAARKRFAFQEVFFIQLLKQKERAENKSRQTLSVDVNRDAIAAFTNTFPFTPTNAQKKAIDDIVSDFAGTHPMARLLEGDVGSGKTAVAAATTYAVAMTNPYGNDGDAFGNLQTAYMVPTEILAKQHFQSFIEYFRELPINIGLITSSGCKKFPSKVDAAQPTDISRTQLLKWVANGEIPIVIGTHSLIQKSVGFENLAYVIIDEQHRFGTVQRRELARKDGKTPHLLSMSATPIPRTLALTIYGDLDITILDELPEGRKPIETDVITPGKRTNTYEKIRKELENGRQAYVICPRIDEPDPNKESAVQAKSVTEEARRLKDDVFPEYEVDILHGKMTPKEKDGTMKRFADGNIHILVATSVVEVGVNVPNATMIVIEGTERFGLAQLHQLRGRVLRSSHQAYCYVFTESNSKKTLDRLKALKSARNGFELAEEDLKLRGAGELYGARQWGLSDIGMEAIKNMKMVEAARKEALQLVEADPTFSKHTDIAREVHRKHASLHFE